MTTTLFFPNITRPISAKKKRGGEGAFKIQPKILRRKKEFPLDYKLFRIILKQRKFRKIFTEQTERKKKKKD